MTDALQTKTFDGKHKNQLVKLTYDVNKSSVRIICTKPETGSEYLRKLITDGHVGLVDAVIYSAKRESKVVALLRGMGLDKFLRSGVQPAGKVPARKSFSQIIDAEESDTGS